MNSEESKKKWKDISRTKKQKTHDFNNKLLESKERKLPSNNNCLVTFISIHNFVLIFSFRLGLQRRISELEQQVGNEDHQQ